MEDTGNKCRIFSSGTEEFNKSHQNVKKLVLLLFALAFLSTLVFMYTKAGLARAGARAGSVICITVLMFYFITLSTQGLFLTKSKDGESTFYEPYTYTGLNGPFKLLFFSSLNSLGGIYGYMNQPVKFFYFF